MTENNGHQPGSTMDKDSVCEETVGDNAGHDDTTVQPNARILTLKLVLKSKVMSRNNR